jgi:aspartate kinase
MKVFKFGGASVNSIDRIRNISKILSQYPDEKILIVISAMGKTTNALEKVAEAFFNNKKEEALQLFEEVKRQHINTAKYVLITTFNATLEKLSQLFTEVEWALHDKPIREFDYYYDQLVCSGELFSSTIMSAVLNEENVSNQWFDVRDVFRTDDNFRDANLDWDFSLARVRDLVLPIFESSNLLVTQGFIGATYENESTTLGREGSDYSAAVFANMLDAESLTIWKDVEAVMNADPREFPDAQPISELNYEEVIEMAYYGAQVIHPKTIKPLQNKSIPLHVKCFLNPSLPGTLIRNGHLKGLPPIIVLKQDQVLIHLHSKDFSFVGEKPVARLYQLFAEIKLKPNLMQTGAISLQVCLDDRSEKIGKLAAAASDIFDVEIEKGLTLLTIRHYNVDILERLTKGKSIVLRQQSPETAQVLMK